MRGRQGLQRQGKGSRLLNGPSTKPMLSSRRTAAEVMNNETIKSQPNTMTRAHPPPQQGIEEAQQQRQQFYCRRSDTPTVRQPTSTREARP